MFEQGRLASTIYDDHYFGASDAIDESRYLYVLGNQLPERFAECSAFGVGELGFGTGLNFLLTWQTWRANAPPGARLNYLAVEKDPIAGDVLIELFAQWPELAPLGQQLVEQYPLMVPGSHQLQFDAGSVVLTLLWGDAKQQLAGSEGFLDCWFLDGFSPRINPDLWDQQTLIEVARLTQLGGSFSTFSVAGAVRRQLTEVGFDWQKVAGFGNKAQMLTGTLQERFPQVAKSPWYRWPSGSSLASKQQTVAVIGGGIAGCSTAYALARKGYQVTLYEQISALATQASGNPAGIVSPFMSADHSVASQFSIAAFEFALLNIKQLTDPDSQGYPDWFHPWGQLRLATDDRSRDRYQRLLASGWFPDQLVVGLDSQQATDQASVTVECEGLLVPMAGAVEPKIWCQALIASAGVSVTVELKQPVDSIHRDSDGWQLGASGGGVISSADIVVIANAGDAQRLLPDIDLAITQVRGQVALVPASTGSAPLSRILSFGRYLLPAIAGQHLIGASFSVEQVNRPTSSQLSQTEHLALVSEVNSQFPEMFDSCTDFPVNGRVSWRAATADRLPLVGPVSAAGVCEARYEALHHGRPADHYPAADNLKNLYLNVGHGSRGLVSAPLSAELIAAHIAGEVAPLQSHLVHALHPDRFRIRALMRRPSSLNK